MEASGKIGENYYLPQGNIAIFTLISTSSIDDGINAKCLARLDEKAIAEVATKLSIGGRAIFPDICKEAMKNVCVQLIWYIYFFIGHMTM